MADSCLTRIQDAETVHYIELPIVETGLKPIVVGPTVDLNAQRVLRQSLDDAELTSVEIVQAGLPLR
jgi:hypothetical protein